MPGPTTRHAEPTDYQATVSGAPVYRTQFTRDALGRITQKIETINGVTDTYVYSYDLRGPSDRGEQERRRRSATATTPTRIGPATPDRSATWPAQVYDAQDRLTQYGTATYTYNNHGDLTSATRRCNTTQYSYDEFGNLTRVVLPGGTQIDYVIDGRNRRIGKKVNGTLVKRWLYDGQLRIVAELDGAGTLVSRFVYADGNQRPGVRRAGCDDVAADHRLPRFAAVADQHGTGAIAGTMNHDEYGRVTQDTLSSLIPFGYAGGHYDSQTGLVRFGARDYDAETGRWTTRDPIGFAGSRKLYGYAECRSRQPGRSGRDRSRPPSHELQVMAPVTKSARPVESRPITRVENDR